MASLQHLANLEATKIAQGRGADPDPYEFERPLERQNRMSRSLDRISVLDTSIPMVPVSSVGKVDVTDAWGMSWAMDSPYDASIAYAKNPAKMASRQSTYFAHPGFDPTFMDGHNSNNGTLLGQNEQASTSSPALSGSSTATTLDSGLTWSEASSASSGASSAYHHGSASGGSITPPATSTSHGSKDKRRSVSFHGDLAGVADGRKSPAARSWHERPRSEIGHDRPEMVRSRSAQPHARASTLQPSLLGNSRRLTTYSVHGTDTQSLKSLSQSMDLPPIPVDPKILAKKEKRMSKAVFPSSPSGADRSSVYSPALTNRKSMDNVSLASNGSRAVGGNASKRKSLTGWLSRSTSSNNNQEILANPIDANSGKAPKGRPVSTMALTSSEPTNAARNFIPPVPPLPLHATRSASSSAAGTPLTSPGLPLTPRSTTPSSANGLSPVPTPGKPHSNNSGRSTPNSSAPPLSNSASYSNSNNSVSNSRSTGNLNSNSVGRSSTPNLSPALASPSVPLAPIISHSSSTSSSVPSLQSGEGVRPPSPLANFSSSSSATSHTNTATTSVTGYLDVKSVQPPKSPTVVHVDAPQPQAQSVHAPRSSSIPSSNNVNAAPRLKNKKSSPSAIQVQLPPGQQMLPTPPHSGTTTPAASSESGVGEEEEGNTTLRPAPQQEQELAPSASISSSSNTILPSSSDSLRPQAYIPANAASLSSFSPGAARLAALSTSSSHSSSIASLQGAPQIPLPPSASTSFASGLAAIADGIQGQSGSGTPASLPRSSSANQLVDRIYSQEEGKAPSTPPKDRQYVIARNREDVISPSSSFHTAHGDNASISLLSPGPTPVTAESGMDGPALNVEGLPPRTSSRQSQNQQLKPRASSPNFRSPVPDASFSSETLKVPAKDAARAAHSSAPLSTAQPQQAAAANRLAPAPQTPRKSKSPFSLFKRSRSKTLGGDDTAKKAPASNNVASKAVNNTRQMDANASNQQTPAHSPTPQLSFSSSTTSRTTTNHSDPSEQFYADFARRPELSSNPSTSGSAVVGNSALKQSTASATGNSGSNSKPSYSFASMFGTSGRKKSVKP